MVFGFFGKKDQADQEEEEDIEPVSFLGPVNGQEVNLKANGRLVEAGLMRAKDLVTDALSRRADTIRIEPKGPQAVVTLLVDGMPYPGGRLPKTEGHAITQMLKLLAGLDVKERKAAQSGGIKAEFDSKPYMLGVKSIPVPDGERLMVRVTDSKLKLDVPADLGMSEAMRVKLRDLCATKGLIIVVGPSGSGTTTTLYALVRNVDAYLYTIFTIGDTEGRKLQQISPLDVDPNDDLATTLQRAIRKEANVILCDAPKEAATAQAMFSKHEGVMILTEMAAKDTSSAVVQLIEWVGDAKLVAAGLRGVVTQKLIRILCPECRLAYKPKGEFLKKLGLPEDVAALYRKPPDVQEGAPVEPCENCGGVGDAKLVAAGLRGVVTQKLIRILCPECRLAYKPKGEFLKKLGLPEDVSALYRKPPDVQEGAPVEPCENCGGVGYLGRTAMFELLENTDGMSQVISAKPDAASIRSQMKKDKMTTLQQDGLRLVAEGRTSLEELQRVFKPA